MREGIRVVGGHAVSGIVHRKLVVVPMFIEYAGEGKVTWNVVWGKPVRIVEIACVSDDVVYTTSGEDENLLTSEDFKLSGRDVKNATGIVMSWSVLESFNVGVPAGFADVFAGVTEGDGLRTFVDMSGHQSREKVEEQGSD